jgi:hypothetical protein
VGAADERAAKERAEAEERERWRAFLPWWRPVEVGLYWIMMLCVVANMVSGARALLVGGGRMLQAHTEPVLLLLLFVPLVGLGAVRLVVRVMGRRAVAREARWLASLPFVVIGYLECLGSYARENERCIYLAFAFDGKPPKMLHDLLKADGGSWSVRKSLATREPGPTLVADENNNRRLVRWFHGLVRDQLISLHGNYPFRKIAVSNDTRGRPS